jgi:hypothetical protein
MAKRFRDTKKWRGWYRELPPVMKLLFDYMCDDCDHAGILKEDYEIASLCIGAKVTREDVEKHLASKVIRIDDDKLFIPSFIEFQYEVGPDLGDKKLNPANNAHKGVIEALMRHGIDPAPWLLGSPSPPSGHPSKKSPSVAPNQGLGRGPGKGIGKGVGTGKGRGGAGEKPTAPGLELVDAGSESPPAAIPCGYCSDSGVVHTRTRDDREMTFRCTCNSGQRLGLDYEQWSPLLMGELELLTFTGKPA